MKCLDLEQEAEGNTMAYQFKTDVLIVGGGPAGASTALSLLKYSDLKVTIVEQSDLDTLRVGEQVSPAIFDLLAYMNIDRTDFETNSFIYGYNHVAAWGSANLSSRYSISSTVEDSIQLDRKAFDLLLLERAGQRGASILPRTRCIDFKQTKEGDWTIELKHKTKGDILVKTNFLVDATGRQNAVSRNLGLKPLKSDELVAIGTFITFEKGKVPAQEVLLETVEEGWWYCATLPNDKIGLTLFTDAGIAKEKQLQKTHQFNQLLLNTRYIKNKIKQGVSYQSPWVRNAYSKLIDITPIKNYIAVGDAIASFDPISSMGIGFALSSACHASKTIIDFENNRDDTYRLDYQNNINTIYKDYQQTKNQFYTTEQRWKESEFWQQRLMSNTIKSKIKSY
ncbi:lysine-epsilon-oxidase maturase LodB [Aquimarina megaterium]|uniref:lysine-epsilon-oxidase maturase LodB n=1 Tax=Aquimarina megaterium TaxID=1443666 RepID=UPI00047022C3|nr:lysine-epsilon-oxidase maturase LodB [Aquimarina megaterium]